MVLCVVIALITPPDPDVVVLPDHPALALRITSDALVDGGPADVLLTRGLYN